MKHLLAFGWLLMFALPVHAATRPSTSHVESAARKACLDRAHGSGHRNATIRSVEKKAKNNFRITLRIDHGRRLLTCEYDGRSGTAQLHP